MSNTLQDIKEEDDVEYLQEARLLGGGQQTQSGTTPNTPNGSGQKLQGQTQQVTPPSQSSLLPVFGVVDVETQDVRTTGGELGLGLSLQQDKEAMGEILAGSTEPDQTVYMNGEDVLLPPLPDVSGVVGSVFDQPITEKVVSVAKANALQGGLDYDVRADGILNMNSGGMIDTPHLVTPLGLNSNSFVNEAPPSVIVGGSLSTDPDNSFDLSKALEIPNNDHNNSNNTTSNITLPTPELDLAPNTSVQNPISPLVSAPMTSLKRKISFSFNPNANNAEAPGLVPPPAVVTQQMDSALHKTSTKSSSSNSRSNSISGRSSSNMAHNILLPMLNTTLETAEDKLHHSIIMETSKRSPRKFSVESHSSSSASVLNTGMNNSSNNSSSSNYNFDRTSNSASSSVHALGNGNGSGSSNETSTPGEDVLYKPHSWLSMSSRTKSILLDGSNGELPDDYTSGGMSPLSTKKEPLLRRASSVILRKTSLKRDSSATPSYASSSPQLGQFQEFRSMSECSMQERASPVRSTRSRKKLFLRSGVPPLSDYDSNGSVASSNMLLSTCSLRSVTSPLPSLASPRDNSAPPSFGSKVKRGFSRIISGHSKRVPAHDSERTHQATSPNAQESNLGSMYRGLGLESRSDSPNGKDILNRTRSDRGDYRISIDSMPASPSALRRSHSVNARDLFSSASNSSIGRAQPSVLKRRNTLTSNISTMAPSIQKRNSSLASSVALTNSGGMHPTPQPTGLDEVEITVDVDELTVSLPTITITEDVSAKNTTPLQTQSNISLDCSYSKSLGSHNNVAPTKLQKPSRITLKEYIAILMNQQMVEDERFAVLEKMFTSSGWCSHDDVLNLRHKRVMINKKWAERISYYQNKLES